MASSFWRSLPKTVAQGSKGPCPRCQTNMFESGFELRTCDLKTRVEALHHAATFLEMKSTPKTYSGPTVCRSLGSELGELRGLAQIISP